MKGKLESDLLIPLIASKITDLEGEMSQPDVVSDQRRMTSLAREHRRLTELLAKFKEIKDLKQQIADNEELVDDPDLGDLAQAELPELNESLTTSESAAKALVIPLKPEDSRNAVMEIRAGTGGDEAALFGADLYKMYTRYVELKGLKHSVLSASFSDLGGVKELIFSVSGENAYGLFKLESGVHRVQRVPTTETQGRVHTSAATVAVLPEAEEVDVEINQNELKVDTYRSSGPGGQHVNKTDSAIRITHLPTGIVVTCQDEKSQLKNKVQAMKVLRARLFQIKLEEEQAKRAEQRRSQVGSGDRSAKIRTYNFPQGRVTDHRVPLTVYRLDEVMAGYLDLIVEPLKDFFVEEEFASALESLEQN
ncbi:peptide chain release factor 1 [Calditrichota bacterium]